MSKEEEEIMETFRRQLERLQAKEAILKNGTFNDALFKQRNPAMRLANMKRLIGGITTARISRQRDLKQ